MPSAMEQPAMEATTSTPEPQKRLTIPELGIEIERGLRALIVPAPGEPTDGVFELRGLHCHQQWGKPKTMSGFYDADHLKQMASEAALLTLQHCAGGVYFCLNPVHPDLLSVRANRCDVAGDGELAGDENILRLVNLLVDADPKRQKKISSTDAEKALAKDTILRVRAKLDAAGWPAPVFADSGNGFHLVYKIALPVEDAALVQKCLRALGKEFSTAAVEIDLKVFNPSRISKAYFTFARKGDSTKERPYRMAHILELPEVRQVVPRELLEALAATAPVEKAKKERPKATSTSHRHSRRHGHSVSIAERAASYLDKIPDSVEGQDGSGRCFHAACVLVRDFNLSIEEAFPILADWNTRHAAPPWSDAELRHKLEGADKAEGERGRLLNDSGQHRNGNPGGGGGGGPSGGTAEAPNAQDCADDGFVDPETDPDPGFDVCDAEDRTELANSRRFVNRFGDEMRFVPTWKKFLAWDLQRWAIDDADVEAMTRAKKIADQVWDATKENMTDDIVDFAVKTAKHAGLKAMINTAASDLALDHRCLDSDQMLLNVENGTIDLTTGKLHPFRQRDYITKMSYVAYLPEANAPRWHQFLTEVFVSPALISFMQRLAGYCLTGSTKEQVLPIFHGCGANGKTTYLTALQLILGEYAGQAPPSLLMVKTNEQHPTELASLFGMRFVVATETEHGGRLAESLVKQLTGSDPITARRMREDFWTFNPTHKLVLCTNHRPKIRGTDYAMWRRLLLCPFTQVFSDDKKDKDLPGKLAAEAPGILRWCVEGALEWQRIGLCPPTEVQQATSEYRSEQDVLGRFVANCCHTGNTMFKVRFSDLYAALKSWCDEIGEGLPSRKLCGQWLKEQGFTEKHSNGCWYVGLALQADPEVER